MKIHIKGGRLIDPKHGIDGIQDVYITAGKIVGIGEAPKGYTANRTVDATGRIVCPGLVDLSARLREPGFGIQNGLVWRSHARCAVSRTTGADGLTRIPKCRMAL